MAKQSAEFVTRLSPVDVYSIQKKQQCCKCFVVFTLRKCLTKYTSLKFDTLSIQLLIKQILFFDKNVSTVLLFYNYSVL